MAKIAFIVADDCGFSGISGMIDSFAIANILNEQLGDGVSQPLFEVSTISSDGRPVRPIGGFAVTPDGAFTTCQQSDVVVVPPFLPNIENYCERMGETVAWVKQCYNRGAAVAAICTGSFLLAETGLLDGRLATTNWVFDKRFRRRYPKVNLDTRRLITVDERLICSGAVSAFFNLCLYLIASLGSVELAARCAKTLLVDPSRTDQAPYAIFNGNRKHGDMEIFQAQQWMENHLSESITVEQLAYRSGISLRHFIRRFKKATGESPINYLQQLRIEVAKHCLETTGDTVDGITKRIGYENSSTFRKLFKKTTGLSPREYRDKFSRKFIQGRGVNL